MSDVPVSCGVMDRPIPANMQYCTWSGKLVSMHQIGGQGAGRNGGMDGQEGEERGWKFRVLYTTRYCTHYGMLGRFRRGQRTVLADPSLVVRP